MCPACIASAALMVGSVGSTGGLTALFLKLRAKVARRIWSNIQIQRRQHGPSNERASESNAAAV